MERTGSEPPHVAIQSSTEGNLLPFPSQPAHHHLTKKVSQPSLHTSVAECLTAAGDGVEAVGELEQFAGSGQARQGTDLGRAGGGGEVTTGLLTFLPAVIEVGGASTASVGHLDTARLALAEGPLGLECEAAQGPRQHRGQRADVATTGAAGGVQTGPADQGRRALLRHADTDTLREAGEQVLSSSTACDTKPPRHFPSQ